MAIYRKVKNPKTLKVEKVAVADFSVTNDYLAQMIVDAWVDRNFRERLLKPANAKSLLAQRGIYLQNPVIIDETKYWSKDGYTKKKDDEVVFVLPNQTRTGRAPQGHSLLDTARLLMACVPNGI
jgi:hypothetical protein